jgi:hypothetical protein
MKYSLPTHEEHLQIAPHFHALKDAFRSLRESVGTRFPKAHPINCELRQTYQRLVQLQGSLDDAFNAVTTDAQFRQRGHVYYADSGTRS